MTQKTILLVDDATFMRKVLYNLLTSNGYNVVGEAENGQIGIDKYKELKPDLTILDVTMDVLDGIDAVKGIIEFDPNAKLIMCSAMMGQTALINEALRMGALDFIKKPFKKEEVLEVVKKIIG